ncbi:MAG TPA: hypothetical protein PKM59_08600 [Thermodesulfobacteriota bacterium]|nr:hypothetical protein [Thermodesulfobacteriota bacterium]HNU71173.1 hypothetical protein [Thermodesulfobacteriota bacterium]
MHWLRQVSGAIDNVRYRSGNLLIANKTRGTDPEKMMLHLTKRIIHLLQTAFRGLLIMILSEKSGRIRKRKE